MLGTATAIAIVIATHSRFRDCQQTETMTVTVTRVVTVTRSELMLTVTTIVVILWPGHQESKPRPVFFEPWMTVKITSFFSKKSIKIIFHGINVFLVPGNNN